MSMITKKVRVTTSLEEPKDKEFVTGEIYRGTKKYFKKPEQPEQPKQQKHKEVKQPEQVETIRKPNKIVLDQKTTHCNVCNKTLKNRAGYMAHCRSKTHEKLVKASGGKPAPTKKAEPVHEPEPEREPVKSEPTNSEPVKIGGFSEESFKTMFEKYYGEKESLRLQNKSLRQKEKDKLKAEKNRLKAEREKRNDEAKQAYLNLLKNPHVQQYLQQPSKQVVKQQVIQQPKQQVIQQPKQQVIQQPKQQVRQVRAKPKPKPKPVYDRLMKSSKLELSEGDVNPKTGRNVRRRTKIQGGKIVTYYE